MGGRAVSRLTGNSDLNHKGLVGAGSMGRNPAPNVPTGRIGRLQCDTHLAGAPQAYGPHAIVSDVQVLAQ